MQRNQLLTLIIKQKQNAFKELPCSIYNKKYKKRTTSTFLSFPNAFTTMVIIFIFILLSSIIVIILYNPPLTVCLELLIQHLVSIGIVIPSTLLFLHLILSFNNNSRTKTTSILVTITIIVPVISILTDRWSFFKFYISIFVPCNIIVVYMLSRVFILILECSTTILRHFSYEITRVLCKHIFFSFSICSMFISSFRLGLFFMCYCKCENLLIRFSSLLIMTPFFFQIMMMVYIAIEVDMWFFIFGVAIIKQ